MQLNSIIDNYKMSSEIMLVGTLDGIDIVFSVHFWELPILVSFVFFLRHLHIWLPQKLAGPLCLHWIQFHKTSELTEEEVYIYIYVDFIWVCIYKYYNIL